MQNVQIKSFQIIGIAVRTTNENGQAAKDIPALWNKFMEEGVLAKIPNKIDNAVFSIYTDYESDYTQAYTTILGCRVNSLDDIPEGLIGKSFPANSYSKFITKGNLEEGIVYNEWTKIWNTELDRNYIADFEIYGAKAQNPANAEVEIFVGVGE